MCAWSSNTNVLHSLHIERGPLTVEQIGMR
jgi:hypothetical protein